MFVFILRSILNIKRGYGNGQLAHRIKTILERSSDMPQEMRKGREVYNGYVRGCGLKYGNLKDLCYADALFSEALEKATAPSPNGKPRTIVNILNLMNIFTIIKLNLSHSSATGHIVEFGSLRGGSAIFMAIIAKELLPGSMITSFDTFKGFPKTNPEVDAYRQGSFENVDVNELRTYAAALDLNNLTFIEGAFEDTIPQALKELGQIALAHIDCDVYDSVAYTYKEIKPYLINGGYLIYDDPLVPTCIGAFEAIEEFLIRKDGLHAEQIFPHLVFRSPVIV